MTVRLWSLPGGKHATTLEGHRNYVASVAFSPVGKTLASAGGDSRIRLWDVRTLRARASLKGHPFGVEAVAFSPDGKALACSTVRLRDAVTGEPLVALEGNPSETGPVIDGPGDWVWSVAFSPDGKTMAAGDYAGSVRLWQVATGRRLSTLRGHTGPVTSVAFSPAGRLMASASLDKTVRLWDLPESKEGSK